MLSLSEEGTGKFFIKMSWTDYFDKIYVINLEKRVDRLEQATEQLNKYNIPFERWLATEHEKGAEGLRLTMVRMFEHAIDNNYQKVMAMEDDLDIIEPEINEVMEEIVKDMPPNFDILYLGCQLCNPPTGFYNKNLLKGIRNAYATHAAIYSLKGMQKILSRNFHSPIDNCIVKHIQEDGECFVVYPLLCSQIVSHSDIYKEDEFMDWKPYIEGKYWKQIKVMQENKTFNTEAKIYTNEY